MVHPVLRDVLSAHYPTIAAVDLGTNSCRLLVANVNVASYRSVFFRSRTNLNLWRIVDSHAQVVRLGEGLHKTGVLNEDAIERAMVGLANCVDKLKKYDVVKFRAVATEACRQADNGRDLIKRAYDELGLSLEIISPQEEARLALMGCAGILNKRLPYAVVFDIGGGSTEVVWLQLVKRGYRQPGSDIAFEVIDSTSIPYGVVVESEKLGDKIYNPESQKQIRKNVSSALKDFAKKHNIVDYIKKGKVQMMGTSGTVTTLAAVHKNLPRYNRRFIDGKYFERAEVDAVSRRILKMSEEERQKNPCIGDGRSDLVIAGSGILQGLFDAFPAHKLKIADRGVREGILSDLVKEIINE